VLSNDLLPFSFYDYVARRKREIINPFLDISKCDRISIFDTIRLSSQIYGYLSLITDEFCNHPTQNIAAVFVVTIESC